MTLASRPGHWQQMALASLDAGWNAPGFVEARFSPGLLT